MNGRGGTYFLFPATARNVTLVSHPHVFAAISPTVRMSTVIRDTSICYQECEFVDTVWYCGLCGRIDRHPVLKAKVKSRQKGTVDVATLELKVRLSQLVEIICLPIEHLDYSGYRKQAVGSRSAAGLLEESQRCNQGAGKIGVKIQRLRWRRSVPISRRSSLQAAG